MSLPRIVVDNSAMLPAFFPETKHHKYDAGLITNRARSLVQAIRMRRVNAYVPPSFFREFLHVGTLPIDQPGGRSPVVIERIRAQWEDLLSLPLIVVPLREIIHHCGILAFDDHCPSADAWYLAAAVHAHATIWISHEHVDGFAGIASRQVPVRLLSDSAPLY
jgi:hypothetical protein